MSSFALRVRMLVITIIATLLVGCFLVIIVHNRSAKYTISRQKEIDHPNRESVPEVRNIPLMVISKKSNDTPQEELIKEGFTCKKKYGKIDVFVAIVTESYKNFYGVAQATLRCYLQSHDYKLRLVNLDTDKRVKKHCNHTQLFFLKHCAASVYLEDADWLLVLDADTGIVNPAHCIEEYIDEKMDLIFYERFFNWEIASGNYLAKNTPFTKKFLRKWADFQFTQPSNWNGADNGVLQILLLQTLLPNNQPEIDMCNKVWRKGRDYDTYMRFVMCCKVALGSRRIWDHIKIYRRAHGWVQDWVLTDDNWCKVNFMFHGWKHNKIGTEGWKSPFTRMPNDSECEARQPWPWKKEKRISCDALKVMLKDYEKTAAKDFKARTLPFLEETDIGDCWPKCRH